MMNIGHNIHPICFSYYGIRNVITTATKANKIAVLVALVFTEVSAIVDKNYYLFHNNPNSVSESAESSGRWRR